jgi:5S rRNA maturation endonuclease (ribonuclease M5)
MKYSDKQLAFIAYNNRSVEGVVSNFIPKGLDINKLNLIEHKLEWSKSFFNSKQKFIEIKSSDLNLNVEDIIVNPIDVESLTSKFYQSQNNFIKSEFEFLSNRGLSESVIKKYRLGSLSYFQEIEDLNVLNATCHPVLNRILKDGLEEGGILIPLFREDKLVNCAVRKISNVGKLKYTLTCPDIDVWGLDSLQENQEVWICEGLFDYMALSQFVNCVSVSSAMWSGIQLYKLLEKKPKCIKILCDNDQVGLKTGAILNKFFNIVGIKNYTYKCKSGKDASEILFEKKLDLVDIEEIKISKDQLNIDDSSFDILAYLQSRKF